MGIKFHGSLDHTLSLSSMSIFDDLRSSIREGLRQDLWIESGNMSHNTKSEVMSSLGSRSYCLFKLLIIQIDLDSRLKFGFKI